MRSSDPKPVEPVAWEVVGKKSGQRGLMYEPSLKPDEHWEKHPLYPASALEAAEAWIAALEADLDQVRKLADTFVTIAREKEEQSFLLGHTNSGLIAQVSALEAENGALREALETIKRRAGSFWISDMVDDALRQAEEKSDG